MDLGEARDRGAGGAVGPRRGTPVPAGQVACQAGDSENAGSAGCEPGDRRHVRGSPHTGGASLWFLRALGVQALPTPGSGNEQLPCSELEDPAETSLGSCHHGRVLRFFSLSNFLTQWLIGSAHDGSGRVAHVPQAVHLGRAGTQTRVPRLVPAPRHLRHEQLCSPRKWLRGPLCEAGTAPRPWGAPGVAGLQPLSARFPAGCLQAVAQPFSLHRTRCRSGTSFPGCG